MGFAEHLTSPAFKENAKGALADPQLQSALHGVEPGVVGGRRATVEKLPEFQALRNSARDIKNHTLAHLDLYLQQFEQKCTAAGGHVHYAVTAEEARAKVLEICGRVGAKLVTKGKSMIGEEIAINDFLEENGITPIETDLGEYLVQIRHELPSHIIMPAVHLTKEQIEADFRRVHTHLPADRNLTEHQTLLTEARVILRDRFLAADVGITGANFLVAETGTSIIVTNEGNGDLTQTLPRVHIVLASIEKVVPTLEDVAQFLRVLARSATAQEMSVYTTLSTGPRRAAARDGALWARALGLLRKAAEALRGRHLIRDLRARVARKNRRPLPLAAACRRLDEASRSPRAGNAHLPGAVEASGKTMTARATLF